MTAASEIVFGQDRRDGFVMAQLAHREKTRGAMKSKKDHAMIYKWEMTASCKYGVRVRVPVPVLKV